MGGHPMSTLIDVRPSFCALHLFLLLTFLLLWYYNIMTLFKYLSSWRFWWSMLYVTINCEGPYNQLINFHNDRFQQAVTAVAQSDRPTDPLFEHLHGYVMTSRPCPMHVVGAANIFPSQVVGMDIVRSVTTLHKHRIS